MLGISNTLRTILARTQKLRGRFTLTAALYTVVGLLLFTGSATATNAYITRRDPQRILVRLTQNTSEEPKIEETTVLGVEETKEEGEPTCAVEEVSRKCAGCHRAEVTKQKEDCSTYTEIVDDQSCAVACPQPTPVPVEPQQPTAAPTPTVQQEPAPAPTPTPVESQQTTTTPTPTPVEEDETEDALDDGTISALTSILFKMQGIRSNIKLYQEWRSEAVASQLDCRKRANGYVWSPAIEDIIEKCRENEQKRIDDYDSKINGLKRELNEYERQKNDIILGCPKCADFWNGLVAELQRRGLW